MDGLSVGDVRDPADDAARHQPRLTKCPAPLRAQAAARAAVNVVAAERPMWFPGAAAPSYLDGSLAGDRGELGAWIGDIVPADTFDQAGMLSCFPHAGFDPMGLGANPQNMAW